MKSIYLTLAFICVCSLLSCDMGKSNNMETELKQTEESTKKLRHIVLFKFKEDVSSLDIKKVETAFAELPSKIKEIKGFEWGLNNSPENLNKGFTHGFVLTFDSEQGRDVYLPHPDHKAFGEIVGPVLEDVMVLDYWTE